MRRVVLAPFDVDRVANNTEEVYVPKVNIRSSQQLSSSTDMLQTCPVLSCAEAEVAVVMMESARGESVVGGCSILKVLNQRPLCTVGRGVIQCVIGSIY
jgi:hypothetical protein